jgi:hypothetical protein
MHKKGPFSFARDAHVKVKRHLRQNPSKTGTLDNLFRMRRPPEEFYRNVLAAGAEPSYMKCVFNSYADYTAGRIPHSDEEEAEQVGESSDNIIQRPLI